MSKRKSTEVIENSVTKIIRRDNIGKAHEWLEGISPTPYKKLIKLISENSRKPLNEGDYVLHWFRSDIRIQDNKSLVKASELAKSLGKPLITLYIASPKDFQSHQLSNVKINLIKRSLLNLQQKLQKLNIPLLIDSIDDRNYFDKLSEICDKYNVFNVYANFEYEIDELRRDYKILTGFNKKRNFTLHHDQCIVQPELIKAKNGNPFKVFKPWYNDWCRHIYHEEDKFLKIETAPLKNKSSVEISEDDHFNLLASQELDDDNELKHMKSLYTDDEDEVHARLDKFIKNDLKDYENEKDYPYLAKSSLISPYINIGLISTRMVVHKVFKQFDSNKASSTAFIREVAWRDFYRHKVVEFPHVVMNLPFNLKTDKVSWENDPAKFRKWCQGETGFPIVDLSMKKLNKDGYLNNRCRMIVANFLVKNLLIDWRYGEEYFMSKLIDGDFCSNNGGWGFVSSTGVNCQPFFRVFNPDLQLKNFDPDLKFVKEWIPDYDPNSYLDKMVDYKQTKEKFIENYKTVL